MMIQEHNGTALIIDTSKIPGYDRLSDFLWVDSYLKRLKIQEKIDPLLTEFYQIERLPVSRADFLSRCKTSHAALMERAAERIHRYLADPFLRDASVIDPFYHFETRFSRRDETPFIPSWSDVEAAIKNLPDDGIDDAQRKKKLEKITSQIASLTTELREHSPLIYCTWRGNKIAADIRQEFVEVWENIQSQLNAPAGPRALELAASSDAERNAYAKLGLAAFVNPQGINPNPSG